MANLCTHSLCLNIKNVLKESFIVTENVVKLASYLWSVTMLQLFFTPVFTRILKIHYTAELVVFNSLAPEMCESNEKCVLKNSFYEFGTSCEIGFR